MEESGEQAGSAACRVFTFKDAKSPEESLSVCIPEVLDPQYGMYVWPSAVVLAQYLWFHRDQLRGRAVLELGAGVGLPGVLAARCGARVSLSDGSDRPRCLENGRRSCAANGLRDVGVLGLSWGDVTPELLLLPPQDVVLGSDVFYDPEDFEDVLVTFVCLLRKNPEAQFWTTYQVRSSDWSLEALLHRWRLCCVSVPLADFGADGCELAGSALPGSHTIHMMIISRRSEVDPPAQGSPSAPRHAACRSAAQGKTD
ncbi:histone-arginine methyltransferase METTL23 [Poecilia latipinna]|uniref:Methyltransferase 23, arginine n=3 Tax=Poecilia TaxID=8080 RepID=A0A3B3U6I1_9TELE|nr:PREDICTED: methyltransferase-like protein 23 [Poecilia latipinna]